MKRGISTLSNSENNIPPPKRTKRNTNTGIIIKHNPEEFNSVSFTDNSISLEEPVRLSNNMMNSQQILEDLIHTHLFDATISSDDLTNRYDFFLLYNYDNSLNFDALIEGQTLFSHLMCLAIQGSKPAQGFIKDLATMKAFNAIDWNVLDNTHLNPTSPFLSLLEKISDSSSNYNWSHEVLIALIIQVSHKKLNFSENIPFDILNNLLLKPQGHIPVYLLCLMYPQLRNDILKGDESFYPQLFDLNKMIQEYIDGLIELNNEITCRFQNYRLSDDICFDRAPSIIQECLNYFPKIQRSMIIKAAFDFQISLLEDEIGFERLKQLFESSNEDNINQTENLGTCPEDDFTLDLESEFTNLTFQLTHLTFCENPTDTSVSEKSNHSTTNRPS